MHAVFLKIQTKIKRRIERLLASYKGQKIEHYFNSQTIYGRLVETLEPYYPDYIDALIFNFDLCIIT